MSQKDSSIATVLRANNQSVTKARLVVFDTLSDIAPLTMHELYEKVSGQLDRASLYRTINLYEELGVVHRIHSGWKYKLELTDTFIAHHHHLTCLRCGKTIDIADEQHIDEFIGQVTRQFGFAASGHQFEIEGYCQECQ